MDKLQRKTVETSRGYTYTYYVTDPAAVDPAAPTILLQHGWPDEAHVWDGVISHLPPGKHRLIVPDMLGYAGTSKPLDPAAYGMRGLARDMVDILDAEGVAGPAVSLGHDWGALVATRLYWYHPDRVSALVLLNVPYMLPSGEPVDLPALNARAEAMLGYPALSYQEFLVTDAAVPLLDQHAGRLHDAFFASGPDRLREVMCRRGATEAWLKSDEQLTGEALRPCARGEAGAALRRRFAERFRRDGFAAPNCYYRASAGNVHHAEGLEVDRAAMVARVPVLYVGCRQDPVCLPAMMEPAKQAGCLPDLEELSFDCSHWGQVEMPEEMAAAVASFLERKLG